MICQARNRRTDCRNGEWGLRTMGRTIATPKRGRSARYSSSSGLELVALDAERLRHASPDSMFTGKATFVVCEARSAGPSHTSPGTTARATTDGPPTCARLGKSYRFSFLKLSARRG